MPEAQDPIRTQLVWNRLLAIVEEQAQTLMRTAFSTVVREAGDLSAGVFNTQGGMLAQAVTGTPGHVNAMAASPSESSSYRLSVDRAWSPATCSSPTTLGTAPAT